MKKNKIVLALGLIISLVFVNNVEAQFLKRLKKRAQRAAENAVIRKTEEKVYRETSKEMDTILGNSKKGDKKNNKNGSKTKNDTNKNRTGNSGNNSGNNNAGNTAENVDDDLSFWMSYDFIPGKEVIFYDDMVSDDPGDFPRRWDLLSGNAEVGKFNNENVLLFYNTTSTIKPLFKEEEYLPEAFTIEFDIYFDDQSKETTSGYSLYFNDDYHNPLQIDTYYPFEVSYKKFGYTDYKYQTSRKFNGWHHIAISYHKGYLKMYFDEQKVLNIPKFDITPKKINKIKVNYSTYRSKAKKRILSIKNFKIAKGGGKPYAQIIADGKFVTHGILFDTGKATLKPQSFGVLKKVTDMLEDNPDWQFEIVGHTDSDGTDETNLTLSQKRAEAVKKAIVDRNIDANRLTTAGKGESEPLNTNKTAEEKANNRRVEFILKK